MTKYELGRTNLGVSSIWRGLALLISFGLLSVAAMAIDVHQAMAGSGGDGCNIVAAGGAAGMPTGFSDDFESTSGWWFLTSDLGNGYVSSRADALSPTHVGYQYSSRNPAGQWQSLNKKFIAAGSGGVPIDCHVRIAVDPITPIQGSLEIDDALTKQMVHSQQFSLSTTNTWTEVATCPSPKVGSFTSNAVIVRVILTGNGAWQEFLVDNLVGSCTF
jgi:hypothetical protein